MCLLQKELDVYYEAIEDINPGQELLTWYGDDYTKYMEIPISMKNGQEKSVVAVVDGETNKQTFLNDTTGMYITYFLLFFPQTNIKSL